MATAVACFDLDGCLVDSSDAIPTALNRALAEHGLPPRRHEDLVRFIGPPLLDNVVTLLREADADPGLARDLAQTYRRHYAEVAASLTRVVPGIPEALDSLSADVALAVVTSKPLPAALPLLEATGLRARFAVVHGPDLDLRAEPKTVTLRRALAEVADGLPSSTVAMIGDREHDIVAGRACGTRTVGVTWGSGTRDELVAAGADHVVDGPDELPAVLSPARRAGR